MGTWSTMATAPKNGTFILLKYLRKGVYCYSDAQYVTSGFRKGSWMDRQGRIVSQTSTAIPVTLYGWQNLPA